MENFQLYRTNLLLGGQVKWDIVLDNDNNKLYVNDFNLTPISDNIPYTYKYNVNLLNYNHQTNLKTFYKQIEGNFYDEGLDDMFNNTWPTIIKLGERPDNVYSNIYDMGCKRSKHYNRYKKQFEFFCPLWLEHVNKSIEFKITINSIINKNGDIKKSLISSRTIDILADSNSKDNKTNDKFAKYLKNYIQYVGIDEGNDRLINIKFKKPTASYVSGIYIPSGIKMTRGIYNIVNNMVTRERPVMETDNMIMNCFVNNNMICSQLFNFNLCFNIEDIISSTTNRFLKGEKLNVCVDVIVDGKELDKRDFYCNYDFIAKEKCYDFTTMLSKNKIEEYKESHPEIFDSINVLDHLQDNKYIDFINKNKYCPKICHWSLNDNTSYIFNIYRGFDGYSIVETETDDDQNNIIFIENEHQYGSTPDTLISEYSLANNNIGWINYVELNYWSDFYDYILNTDKYLSSKATLLNGQTYINGLKYNFIPYKNEPKYVIFIKTTSKILNNIYNSFSDEISRINSSSNTGYELILLVKNNLIMFITDNFNNLTFASVKNMLENNKVTVTLEEHTGIIDNIKNMMNNVITPDIIPLTGTLIWNYVDGPSKETNEITYYKHNDIDYVLRYDGNIKPYFIDRHDIMYYKDFISDDRKETEQNPNGISNLQKSDYTRYAYTGFESNYPSINYSACRKIESYNDNIIPNITVSEYNEPIPLIDKDEYSWFNNGIIVLTIPKLNFTYINKPDEKNEYKQLNDIIAELISNYYGIEGRLLNHVIDLYNVKSDWEYYSLTNINDYIYNIELTLK